MVVFSYQDYLACKKIISSNLYVKEDSSNYYISTSNAIHNVHDALYRDLLNDKKELCTFLKNFINYDVSCNEISKYNTSFITNEYESRYTDVIYKLKNKPIYILIEHQSYIDNSISYRIFDYYSLILRDTIDKENINKKDYKFPLVIPIIFYTGAKNWKLKPNIKEKQYNFGSEIGKLDIEYYFINTNQYSTDELLKMKSYVSYVMAIDKCTSTEKLLNIINKLSIILDNNEHKKYTKRIIKYILNAQFDKDTTEMLLNKFNERNDVTMKYVWDYIKEDQERIAKELLAKGTMNGKREGKLEGELECKSKFVKNMLKNGETIEKIRLYTGATKKEIEKIRNELAVC